jgi:MFS transporter, PPP family, 3-phenylpropionic acid transporter
MLPRPPVPDAPSRWFAERVGLYFAALFLIYGTHVTYFPVWLAWRGLSPEQIGLITALPIFLRVLVTPAIAARADARRTHREMIVTLSVLCAALAMIISQCTTFSALLLTVVPFTIAVASIMPLTETIAVSGARAAGHDYGWMRLWGSLTFLVSTVVSGLVYDAYGAAAGVFVLVGAAVVTAGAACAMPPAALVSGGAPADHQREPGVLRALARKPQFLLFLLAVGGIFGSHAAFYTFGAIHLKGQGVSGTAFSALWAVSIIAEVALLAVSAPLTARFRPTDLFIAASAMAALRWGAMSLDPPFAVLVVLQVLHAATYGAAHLGAMAFIAAAVPDRGAGQAQALYSAIGNGLVTGLATLAAGHLYPMLGGRLFLVMAALAAVGAAAAIALSKAWDGQPLIEPAPSKVSCPT